VQRIDSDSVGRGPLDPVFCASRRPIARVLRPVALQRHNIIYDAAKARPVVLPVTGTDVHAERLCGPGLLLIRPFRHHQNPLRSGRVRSSTTAFEEMRALVPVFAFVGIPHEPLSVTIFLAPAEAPFKNRPHLADVLAAVRAQIAGSPARLPSDKSDSFSPELVRHSQARLWVPIERALLAWPVHGGKPIQKRQDDQ
jgi:hypothetical protein